MTDIPTTGTIGYTGSIETYTVATTGTYDIIAYGGQGGQSGLGIDGGQGAQLGGDFDLTSGEVIEVVVGGMGGTGTGGASGLGGGGGGGGTFVFLDNSGNLTKLVIAGGGGGGAYDTGGGGVTTANGAAGKASGSYTPGLGGTSGYGGGSGYAAGGGGYKGDGSGFNGATGGSSGALGFGGGAGYTELFPMPGSQTAGGEGGFGGGGGGGAEAGSGGGGYSGGGGGAIIFVSGGTAGAAGGGGGSYLLSSATNQVEMAGENTGNGFVSFDLLCFLEGTLIATPDGERSVETLTIGDLVTTADGASAPVRWIGRRTLHAYGKGGYRFADPLVYMPIRIKAGALGKNLPTRDLFVSAEHALLVDGLLVQAGALVNGTSVVRQTRLPERFTYYHIELAEHALVLAEGVPVETFVDNVQRIGFDNWAEHEALYGNEPTIAEMTYPRVQSLRQLPLAVRRLMRDWARALMAGTQEPVAA